MLKINCIYLLGVSMSKEQNVVEFYVLCNKLKHIIRSGWKAWNVKADRLESIAEHIFGVQMLAIAMWSEYKYDIDLKKVLFMLAMHETEEILIGDLTIFDVDNETKKRMGHEAVAKVLGNLANKEFLQNIIIEFDERKTPEAIFAYQCDKLECDLQCKLYDEQGCVDLKSQKDNKYLKNENVQKLIYDNDSWSKAWLKFGQHLYKYDENFLKISNYIMDKNITK